MRLDELGMPETLKQELRSTVTQNQGMLLIAGPTGSGKTTTLYALLEELRTGREKIITLEDPIEYRMQGVCQVPVNLRGGLGFADALRAVLRQDPDVILVGEIRDRETALLATQAALTGHFVLATIHTGDAPSSLIRLHDLGVPPYLIASTVVGALAQRLARRICRHCSPPSPQRAASCGHCMDAGFRGRVGVFEFMTVGEDVRGTLLNQATLSALREAAAAAGLVTLAADGRRHVENGTTSAEEIRRVLSWSE
jgi:general secretion pathway protein E